MSFFLTILHKITSLPPSGLGKQGGLQKKSYNTLVFLGGRGTSKNVSYIFGGLLLWEGRGGLENVSWTYLTCKGGWPL